MMTDYIPIDCAKYNEYELAILRNQTLRIAWHDTHGLTHLDVLRPRDLQTRLGEEYLIAESRSGERLEIRLDQITESNCMRQ